MTRPNSNDFEFFPSVVASGGRTPVASPFCSHLVFHLEGGALGSPPINSPLPKMFLEIYTCS